MKQSLLAIIPLLVLTTTANVYAGGPRLDWPEDSTSEGKDCWVEGWDAGFSGKYDKARADRCAQENDEYNRAWNSACKDAGYTPAECNNFKNNPVNLTLEDRVKLYEENRRGCYDGGFADGKATSYDRDRSSGCGEYGDGYKSGFKDGCESIEGNTYDSCQILMKGYKGYCPHHPESRECTGFLQNPFNKGPPEGGICAGMGDPRPDIICAKEGDPELYCLNHNDPAFCKTVGDICDADGSVKPEDAYCATD